MQFGVLSNKRVTENQKIQYLTRLSNYFEKNNYDTKILKEKHRGKRSYIAVVGDVKRAKYIIATHYDTPMIDFLGKNHDPFNDKELEKKSTLNLTFSLVIFIFLLFLVINYYLIPQFGNNMFNLHDVVSGLITIFLLVQTYKIVKNGGFAKRHNLVRNTSSVIAILNFVKELKQNKKDYAFAFVDYGTIDYFGYYVLDSYLGDISKKMILLDTIGTPEIEVSSDKSNVLSNIFGDVQFMYSTKKNLNENYEVLQNAVESASLQLKNI